MSRAAIVSRLAVRELWMSFRLLLVLIAFVAAGAFVALVTAPLSTAMERLAIGLGIATGVGAAVAAWAVAEERQRGRAGWLVARDVPRGTYLTGWFAGLALVAVIGHLVGTLIGWLAVGGVTPRLDPLGFAVAAGATMAAALAGVALGLLAGVVMPPLPAVAATLIVGVVAAVAAVAGVLPPALLPVAGAFALLAAFRDGPASLGPSLVATGMALAATGLLLILARLALERADL